MPTQAAESVAEEMAEGTFDASDPKQVNESRTKAGRRRKIRLDLISALMDVPEGRAWIYEKLVECHIYAPTFVPTDPHFTAFKEGERHVGLGILADVMAAAEDKFIVMCREAREKK